jgi:hypothetical protein
MVADYAITVLLETHVKLELAQPRNFADYWRSLDDAEISELINLHACEDEVTNFMIDVFGVYSAFSRSLVFLFIALWIDPKASHRIRHVVVVIINMNLVRWRTNEQ